MGEKGPPPTSLSGLLFSFIAGLFFLADGLIIQISSVASIDLIFWICAVQLIVLFPIIHYRHHNEYENSDIFGPLNKKGRPLKFMLLSARGFCGGFGTLLICESYKLLPIGDVKACAQTGIIWATLISWVWNRDKPHWLDLVAIPVTIVGVVFFAKPPFIFGGGNYDSSAIKGLLFVLSSSFIKSWSMCIIRKMGKSVHYSISILYFALNGLIISGIFITFRGNFVVPCKNELILIFYCGINSILGQVFYTLALQREQPGRVKIVRSSEIVIAYLCQIFLFGTYPNLYSILGAILITASALAVVIRKLVKS